MEIASLESGKSKIRRDSTIHKLNPILEDGLLRVGGRLCKIAMPEEVKHPVILSINSTSINRLVMVEGKYWITHDNEAARRILSSCVFCRRQKPKLGKQLMADSHEERLLVDLPPFTNVGMDYFGPIEVN